MSEIIQIGIPFMLMKYQNIRNILINLKVNFVSSYFFFKMTLNKLISIRLICFQYSTNSCKQNNYFTNNYMKNNNFVPHNQIYKIY